MRHGHRISSQQLQLTGIDLLSVSLGFGEEELQPLNRRMLRPGHRLGPPASAVSVLFRSRGASSPGQVLSEPPPLR
jgi:hypothetical protein